MLPSPPRGRRLHAGPRTIALCALLALGLLPGRASAQISDADKATARALAQQGQDALDKRDFPIAADRFARAAELVHAPTLPLGLARAQVGLGRWIAAAETYNRLLREPVPGGAPPVFIKALADARKELADLEPRIPSVTIAVKGSPAARVWLDGTPVPGAALGVARPVDPGKHAVRAEADGFAPAQAAFTATERRSEAVTLTLDRALTAAPEPPPALAGSTPSPRQPDAGSPPLAGVIALPPPPPAPSGGSVRRTLGFVGIGVGGAGLVLGAVTGGLAIPKHSALQTACPGGHCPSTQADALAGYHVLTNLSTAGFIAGGVLAATGVVLFITAPRATASAGVAPLIGAGYAGAKGWF